MTLIMPTQDEKQAFIAHIQKIHQVADTLTTLMNTTPEIHFSRKQGLKVWHETHEVICTGCSDDPERDTITLEVSQDGNDWVYTMQWDYLRGDLNHLRYESKRYQITSGLYKTLLTVMENLYRKQFKPF